MEARQLKFKFKTKPYRHQVAAFKKFKDAEYSALFADMGTGKSKIALDIMGYNYCNGIIDVCLIIAPNSVHTSWAREQIPKHCPVPFRLFVWDSAMINRRLWARMFNEFLIFKTPGKVKILCVNVEAFQSNTIIQYVSQFVKSSTPFIIVDEATRIKTHTAKRSKMIHKLSKYGIRTILTGTPTTKSPFDLWSMFEFLKANYFGCNFFVFQHRYGIMMKGTNPHTGGRFTTIIDEKTYNIVAHKIKKMLESRGGTGLMPDDYEAISVICGVSEKNVHFISANPVYARFKKLDELRELIAPDVYSVKKVDCLDLPPKVYEKLEVDMSKEQARIYNNLKTELLAQYEGQELTVKNKVALTTRLLQVCGGFFPFVDERGIQKQTAIGTSNAKIDALLIDLEEIDEQVIVWAHFKRELEAIKTALHSKGINAALFYGKTEPHERKRIIKEFQNGEIRVFVGNPAVAGFGLNLQNATLQYFFSNSYSVENRLQAEDRSHRIGVKSTCVYKDIVLKGTLDEKVHESIRTGRALNDYFKSHSLREILTNEKEA